MKFSYMNSLCEISVIEMPHVNIMKPILNQVQIAFWEGLLQLGLYLTNSLLCVLLINLIVSFIDIVTQIVVIYGRFT
jgi:hypothetical protein